MSVSLYAYTPEFCDNEPCCGDCDLCPMRNFYEVEENENE